MAQQLRIHTATGRQCSQCGKTLFDTGYGKALSECSKHCKDAATLLAWTLIADIDNAWQDIEVPA